MRQRSGDLKALDERGFYFATHRQFERAEADYVRALELEPEHHFPWIRVAFLRLQRGDNEGYRAMCRGMLDRFADSTDRNKCDRVAKTCAAAPGAVDAAGLERLARMTDRAVAPGVVEFSGWFELSKGMVEYRRGMWDLAADRLNKAIESADLPPLGRSTALLFVAMTHHRAGRPAEALESLRRGIDLLENDVARAVPADGTLPTNWHDWILVHAVRREAEELITPKSSSTRAGR